MKRTNPKWIELTREQQDLYLKILWQDSYSELAIARFLGTTKGTIVGRRRKANIITRELKVKADGGPVNPERFYDLLELHELEQRDKKRRRKW